MFFKIDLKIFIIAIVFMLMKKCELYACIMLFAFIHELGHLIVGIIVGFKPTQLSIMPYGFNLSFKINYDDYNKKIKKGHLISVKKIIIALAGPLTNFLIATIIYVLTINNINLFSKSYINESIFYSNILLGLFNLIPIYPMDGGRILQEILHIWFGLPMSYKIIQDVTWISMAILTAISSVLILYYENIFIFIVISYLWVITIKNIKIISLKEQLIQKGTPS